MDKDIFDLSDLNEVKHWVEPGTKKKYGFFLPESFQYYESTQVPKLTLLCHWSSENGHKIECKIKYHV